MEKKRKFLPSLGTIMKISILQLSLSLLTVMYTYGGPDVHAQELLMKSVTIHVVDTDIKTVLTKLESKADLKFVYTSKSVPLKRKISLKVTNRSVAETLQEMFSPDKVTYKIVNNRILLSVEEQPKSSHIMLSPAVPMALEGRSVQGKVTDENGEGLPGVNILVKGTQVGTTTSVDGTFRLEVDSDKSVLVFSFVGYLSKEIQVGAQAILDVTLEIDNKTLDELVVVGYGTTKKVNLTGAVSQIDSKVLEDRPSPNLARMLQGTLPNLNISMRDGSPTRGATFNIRGTTSIGSGGSALILIDGVEGDPNMLNPNDIESVSILKDASSAAVYGSRAAFGVVLITTKKPVKGKTKIDFSSNFSINQKTVKHNFITEGYPWLLNFQESFNAWYDYKTMPTVVNNSFPFDLDYLEAFKQHAESGSTQDVIYNESKRRYQYFGSTNWLNEIYKEAMPATEQALSISGGGDKASYLVSGRYFHQDGIFKHNPDKFNRYNLRAKGDVKINNWLTVQNNTELGTQDYYVPIFAGESENFWRNIEIQAFPMAVMRNPDDTYTLAAARSGVASYLEGSSYGNQTVTTLRNTTGIIATPIKDIVFKADLTFSNRWETDQKVNNFVNYSDAPGTSTRLGNSVLRQADAKSNYLASNITATYTKVFDKKHNFSALVGYNVESYQLKNQSIQRDGLLVEGKPDFNLMDGINYTVSGGGNEWAYLGLFYRMNYNYADKYLLELNGRYDGSSKFPASQRFGFFPSISGGWVISNERFFENVRSVVDNVKLRASYGTLGNGNVAPYAFMEQMSVQKSPVISRGVQPNYTRAPGVIPDGLTWEKSTTMNFGIDLGLWSNAFNVTFDWYRRATNDMFTPGQPLPNVFGAAVPQGNYADLLTKGWELTVNYKNQFLLGGKPFNWGITGSVWDSQAHCQKYNNPNKLISTYYEGQRIGDIWGYTTLGLFKTDEEALNSPSQKFLGNSNANVWLAGDLKFADLNNDGVINQGKNTLDDPGDRSVIGNAAWRYNFGFTVSGRWNGLGVSAFFQGVGKREWYFSPEAGMFWGPYNRPYGYQPTMMMNNIWSEENPDAYFPRMRGYSALQTTRSLGAPQTRYLQDISYLRLKNLTVDYSLPKSWTSKVKLSGVKIFVTAQNLFTFSGLFKHTDNFDPEVVETPANDYVNGQGQGYAYPMLKTTTIGLNISL
jgi:TonB-linked SusC/RagA family outer membrane protein